MTEERCLQIEARLGILEQVSKGLEARVSRMERRANIIAPPIQTPPPTFDIPARQAVTPPEPPAKSNDAEYQLGAQWLPRIGAGLVVLGIAYLIALAVNNGWITPPMLFGGAVLLCAGFMAVGQMMRNEREDFGQVLTGIGSCGLFATLAGGHIYQNLYTGETMVAGFVLWGLANLGYAMWRASRSFLAIGIIGGFLGSSMPLSKEAYYLSLGLHGIILVVSAMIVMRHRFGVAAVGLWVASIISLVPIGMTSNVDWMVKIAALELSTLVCVVAYLIGREKQDASQDCVLIGGLVGLAGVGAFVVKSGLDGSAHVLVLAAVCALLALAFRKDKVVSGAWAWTSVMLASILAPLGLDWITASFAYSSIAIVAGLVSVAIRRDEPLIIASMALPASVVLYLMQILSSSRIESSMEIGVLSLLLIACGALGLALRRSESDLRNLLAFLVGWGAISRLGTVLLALPSDFRLANFGVTAAWVVYGVVLLAIGFIADLRNYRYASLTVLLSAVGKVLILDMATATPELRVAVLIGVGLALVAGGYAYIRRRSIPGS